MNSPSRTPADVRVSADWIAANLDDPKVRLVEVDVSASAYDEGHIPGAILWNAYTDLRHPDYRPVSVSEFAALLSRSGLTPETTIVFYGYAAHLGFHLMDACGHPSARLMEGSREQWLDAGNEWSTEVPAPAPSSYSLASAGPAIGPSCEEVEAYLGDPSRVIVDVRSQAEYDGDQFWPSGATEGAGRPGRIPAAVHVPIDLLRTEEGLRSPEEIGEALRERGVGPDREAVLYCTIGIRASQAWFAMKYLLDYPDATVYYGSWAEWGTLPGPPVETS